MIPFPPTSCLTLDLVGTSVVFKLGNQLDAASATEPLDIIDVLDYMKKRALLRLQGIC